MVSESTPGGAIGGRRGARPLHERLDLRLVATLVTFVAGMVAVAAWRWFLGAGADPTDLWLAVACAGLAALVVGVGSAYLRRSAEERAERDHLLELRRLVTRDPLSGLYNYAYVRERLRSIIEDARAPSTALTLLLLDLDGFSEANERFGHVAGDAMLAAIAAAIAGAVGDRGVVGRFGGDEFAVLLEGNAAAADALAVSITTVAGDASVRATPANGHLRIGLSYGAAQFPHDGDTDAQLIARAEAALLASKSRVAEAAARRAERHAQDVFFAIGEAMGRSLDATDTLDNVVRAVGGALALDSCAIRLVVPDGQMPVRAFYLAEASQFDAYSEVERDRPATRDEFDQAGFLGPGATYIDDVRESTAMFPRYRLVTPPGTWLLNIPLETTRAGVLTLAGRHELVAPPAMDLANAIARLVTAAINNAEMYGAVRRQSEQIARLAGIGALLFGGGDFEERLGEVARAVADLLRVDSLTLDTIDPEGQKPFCRHFYTRPTSARTAEELGATMQLWRDLRPQLTETDTMRWLASLKEPLVLDDAMHNEMVPEIYREIVARAGLQTIVLVPIVWRDELKGIFYFAGYNLHAFTDRDIAMMHSVAAQLAPSIQIATMHVELEHSYGDLKEAHLEAILRLAYAAEARDPYTGRHLHRIKAFSAALGTAMGLDGEQLEALGYGAVVHDLGKLRIPDSILIKAGELSEEEWRVMKRHPEYGAEFLGSSPFYDVARQVAMHHHERWDGSGYPQGLHAEEIPLAARIVSVADVYDALTSDRPYKVAWPPERALAELLQMRGKGLCPHSVDAFLRLWNDGTIAEIERESGHASFEFDFRERYAA
jgi:diguanylate cyclase (GGDEF)-like protein